MRDLWRDFPSFKRHGKWAEACGKKCGAALAMRNRPPRNPKKVSTQRVRRVRKICKCGNPMSSDLGKTCRACFIISIGEQADKRMSALTLGEVKEKGKDYKSRHAYQKIRNHAKSVIARDGRPRKCVVCGYDVSVQICHKKPIAQFSNQATVMEINNPLNLILLCRNHHWELDNGYLNL